MDIFDPDKITISEAAKLLHKTPQSIRNWVNKGLEARKIGKTWMTTKSALEDYINKNEVSSNE
tara:strand:+ start:15400 stop:15588 length:189 start_codon:yes stop_codon:yes gene_type:complete